MVVENIINSFFFGGCIALVLTVMVFFISLMVNNRIKNDAIVLLVIGAYFIYALILSSLIIGGLYAKNKVSEIGESISKQMDENAMAFQKNNDEEYDDNTKSEISITDGPYAELLNKVDIEEIMRQAKINGSVPEVIVDKINDKINDYIKKCVMWLLFGTLTVTILSAALAKGKNKEYVCKISDYGFDNDISSSEYY